MSSLSGLESTEPTMHSYYCSYGYRTVCRFDPPFTNECAKVYLTHLWSLPYASGLTPSLVVVICTSFVITLT